VHGTSAKYFHRLCRFERFLRDALFSTDASLDFIEVKMADVLTGSTITLWRYVPDIRDSMYQRIGDTEYFNRLVIEVDAGNRNVRPVEERDGAEHQYPKHQKITHGQCPAQSSPLILYHLSQVSLPPTYAGSCWLNFRDRPFSMLDP